MHKGTYADDCLVNRVMQVIINLAFILLLFCLFSTSVTLLLLATET